MGKRQAALRLIGVGWFMGISILLGILAGFWLDNRFNTGPLFMILGVILGVIVAFYGLYRMLLPLIGNQRDGRNR